MPALLMSTSIGVPASFLAKAWTSAMLATSIRSTRTFGCSATTGASDSGTPSRRCVAMTVQPLAAYCLTSSRPNPEFAPVISTVSAAAADVAAMAAPATSAASARAERLFIATPPRVDCALWYRGRQHAATCAGASFARRRRATAGRPRARPPRVRTVRAARAARTSPTQRCRRRAAAAKPNVGHRNSACSSTTATPSQVSPVSARRHLQEREQRQQGRGRARERRHEAARLRRVQRSDHGEQQ